MTPGAKPAPDTFDVDVDVAIVGAGAAGLVAALAAIERGRSVVVLERDAVPAGSTALSSGLVPAAGTKAQAAAGIADTRAAFAADILEKAKHTVDAAAVAVAVDAVAEAIDWLAARHALPFEVIEGFTYPGHSALRMHAMPERSGQALVDRLRAAAESADVPVLTGALVDTLFTRDGAVVGVGLARPDGTRETIGASSVVLACNGYGGNPALVARHVPSLKDALWFGHSGNDGTALLFGEALGAASAHLSGHQGHGSVAHPHGILITWATIAEGGYQVNRDARRFHDESTGYSEAAAAVVAQPGAFAATIFDARIAGIARQFTDFREAEAQGAILVADDIGTLATRLGLDPTGLAATHAEVEAAKRAGARDRFGRDFTGVASLVAPFAGVKVTGALFHTQGGLVVDAKARVRRPDGATIPGLFAAGGAAAGLSGPRASGYLSGNGLLTAVAQGYLAGRTA